MTTTRKPDAGGAGLRPWQTRGPQKEEQKAEQKKETSPAASSSAASASSSSAAEGPEEAVASFGSVDPKATAQLVNDVLEVASERKEAAVSEQVSSRNF